jgi:hypothetical protein
MGFQARLGRKAAPVMGRIEHHRHRFAEHVPARKHVEGQYAQVFLSRRRACAWCREAPVRVLEAFARTTEAGTKRRAAAPFNKPLAFTNGNHYH